MNFNVIFTFLHFHFLFNYYEINDNFIKNLIIMKKSFKIIDNDKKKLSDMII